MDAFGGLFGDVDLRPLESPVNHRRIRTIHTQLLALYAEAPVNRSNPRPGNDINVLELDVARGALWADDRGYNFAGGGTCNVGYCYIGYARHCLALKDV